MMRIGDILSLLGLTEEGVHLRSGESKRAFAKQLREHQTPAERLMARVLYHLGIDAEPQVVLLGYIVDFFDASTLTVIEVDGPIHEQQRGYDRQRDAAMERAGYRVIRVTNAEVYHFMSELSLMRDAA